MKVVIEINDTCCHVEVPSDLDISDRDSMLARRLIELLAKLFFKSNLE